jgi:hypothetical protein
MLLVTDDLLYLLTPCIDRGSLISLTWSWIVLVLVLVLMLAL